MGRSQDSFNKKDVQARKEKKRKEKEKKRLAKKEGEGKKSLDDMIAYVDETGQITSEPPDPNKKTEVDVNDIEVSVAKQDSSDKEDLVNKGVVAYFSSDKGFGFIRDSRSQDSIFVHINNAYAEIQEGHKVTFDIGKGPKGPMAMNVKLDK